MRLAALLSLSVLLACTPHADPTCGPGTQLDGDRCVAIPPTTCGAGTVLKDGQCVVAPGAIHGTVLLTGAPSNAGATVSLVGTSRTATTAADGTFDLDQLPAGAYVVSASAAGYFDAQTTAQVQAGMTTSVAMVLQPVPPKARLTGTATRFGGEDPTAIAVHLQKPDGSSADAHPDATGAFSFPGLDAGDYALTFEAPHAAPEMRSARISGTADVALDPVLLYRGKLVDPRPLVAAAFLAGTPARALVTLHEATGDLTYVHDLATDALTRVGPGAATLLANDADTGLVVMNGALQRLALATGALTAVTPAMQSLVGWTADAVLYLTAAGDLMKVTTASAAAIPFAARPCPTTVFSGLLPAARIPDGSWITLQATGACNRIDVGLTAVFDPQTGRHTDWGTWRVGDPRTGVVLSLTYPDVTHPAGPQELRRYDPASDTTTPVASAVTKHSIVRDGTNVVPYVLRDVDASTGRGTLSLVSPDGVLTDVASDVALPYDNIWFPDVLKPLQGASNQPVAVFMLDHRILGPCADLEVVSAGTEPLVFCADPGSLTITPRHGTPRTYHFTGTPELRGVGSSTQVFADGATWLLRPDDPAPLRVCDGDARARAEGPTHAAVFLCGSYAQQLVLADPVAKTVRPFFSVTATNVSADCVVAPLGNAAACDYVAGGASGPWPCGASSSCVAVLGPHDERASFPFPFLSGYLRAAFSEDGTGAAFGVDSKYLQVGIDGQQVTSFAPAFAANGVGAVGSGGHWGIAADRAGDTHLVDLVGRTADVVAHLKGAAGLAPSVAYVDTNLWDLDTNQQTPLCASATGCSITQSDGALTIVDAGAKVIRRYRAPAGLETLATDFAEAFDLPPNRQAYWSGASTDHASLGVLAAPEYFPVAQDVLPQRVPLDSVRFLTGRGPDASHGSAALVLVNVSLGLASGDGVQDLHARARLPLKVIPGTSAVAFDGVGAGGAPEAWVAKLDGSEAHPFAPAFDTVSFLASDTRVAFTAGDTWSIEGTLPKTPVPLEATSNLPGHPALSADGATLLYDLAEAAASGRRGFFRAEVR